jgi:hypothetical protein
LHEAKKSREIHMRHIRSQYLIAMAASFLCFGLMFGINASAADQNACSEDIAKFCKNIEPGMIALIDCLEKHENELSSACKDYEATLLGGRVERRERVREQAKFRRTCMNDMSKFCKDADPAQGGLLQCLKEHENELSSECNESIKAMQK